RAVRIGTQNDGAEGFRRGQLALDVDGSGNLLADRIRRGADATGGNLGVLGGDGADNVFGSQLEADHLVGIHPDTHRTLGGEQLRAAHTRHAADFAEHVAVQVV